ncbi:MAG: hypothetical protein ACXADB_05970 [Candidatus Hermodarchaeia archaeon]|jgi:hypothetical protein
METTDFCLMAYEHLKHFRGPDTAKDQGVALANIWCESKQQDVDLWSCDDVFYPEFLEAFLQTCKECGCLEEAYEIQWYFPCQCFMGLPGEVALSELYEEWIEVFKGLGYIPKKQKEYKGDEWTLQKLAEAAGTMKCSWCGVEDDTVEDRVHDHKKILGPDATPKLVGRERERLCDKCGAFWVGNFETGCATGTAEFIEQRKKEVGTL